MNPSPNVHALVRRIGEECGLLPDDHDRRQWREKTIGMAMRKGLVKAERGCTPHGFYGYAFFLTPKGWELAASLGVAMGQDQETQRAQAAEVERAGGR